MLNVHISYKTTRYWRIIFWFGVRPRQFINMKNFRALVVPSGGCRKGIIIQGSQMPLDLLVIGQSCLRIKSDLIGASVHGPI